MLYLVVKIPCPISTAADLRAGNYPSSRVRKALYLLDEYSADLDYSIEVEVKRGPKPAPYPEGDEG